MLSGCLREWCPGDGARSAKLPQPSSAPSPPSLGEEGPGQSGAQWHQVCCLPDKMATFGVVSVMGGRYRPDQLTPHPVAEGLDGTRRTPHRSPDRLNLGNSNELPGRPVGHKMGRVYRTPPAAHLGSEGRETMLDGTGGCPEPSRIAALRWS